MFSWNLPGADGEEGVMFVECRKEKDELFITMSDGSPVSAYFQPEAFLHMADRLKAYMRHTVVEEISGVSLSAQTQVKAKLRRQALDFVGHYLEEEGYDADKITELLCQVHDDAIEEAASFANEGSLFHNDIMARRIYQHGKVYQSKNAKTVPVVLLKPITWKPHDEPELAKIGVVNGFVGESLVAQYWLKDRAQPILYILPEVFREVDVSHLSKPAALHEAVCILNQILTEVATVSNFVAPTKPIAWGAPFVLDLNAPAEPIFKEITEKINAAINNEIRRKFGTGPAGYTIRIKGYDETTHMLSVEIIPPNAPIGDHLGLPNATT